MEKIKTIFDRDWDGNKGVIDSYIVNPEVLKDCKATEKVDGTNVRLTVERHKLITLEKRRNPSRDQKEQGIINPWYVFADNSNPSDKHIFEAANNTDLSNIPDGRWSGEAIGPKIQGNPLKLEKKSVLLFSCGKAPILTCAPITFASLSSYLRSAHSLVGHANIEGIVWHHPNGQMYKIKCKDFK